MGRFIRIGTACLLRKSVHTLGVSFKEVEHGIIPSIRVESIVNGKTRNLEMYFMSRPELERAYISLCRKLHIRVGSRREISQEIENTITEATALYKKQRERQKTQKDEKGLDNSVKP